jgi:hypothetical protein
MSTPAIDQAHQSRVVKTLITTQVLNGVGVAGTVAAGSLLVASMTDSETLAGLAQTFSVLGEAAMALPQEKLDDLKRYSFTLTRS